MLVVITAEGCEMQRMGRRRVFLTTSHPVALFSVALVVWKQRWSF